MTLQIPDWELEVDCEVEAPWTTTGDDWAASARIAARAAHNVAPELDNTRLIVSILYTNDQTVHELNRQWRQRDKPTNVLSFPMLAADELRTLRRDGPPIMLGDVVLAYETCAREAQEKGLQLFEHAYHLLIHGMLHLAGYDHETGDTEATAMEALEVKALSLIGIANPYGDRG